MTKDEFLSMLSEELENLEEERKAVRQKVEYFKAVNSKGRESQEAEYQLKIVERKVNRLKDLLTFPAYARIQAMSDIEIEEYKKEKIEELELKIKEIESREEQEKAKLSQLKAEQEQLMTQFGTLSGSERDRAISRGQQLSTEIIKYDVDNEYGVFAPLKKEIEEVRKQQEQIEAMTSQEVKQQLSSEIKESDNLAQQVEWAKQPINASTELEASVGSDTEKAQQMANLLARYERLSDEQKQIKGRKNLHLIGLPSLLERKLRESYYYDSRDGEIRDPDKLMLIVQEFEASFERAKASVNEQFTEQKLSKLVYDGEAEYGYEYSYNSEVDMEFLQQHTDKLGDGKLKRLQMLVEDRNKLSKKIFKTYNTKWEIKKLNEEIIREKTKICKELTGWYNSQGSDILNINRVDFYDLKSLQDSLKRCKELIGYYETNINDIKEDLQKVKAEMEQQRQNYENEKTEIAQKIRALGGENHKETEMPYASDSPDYNLNSIINSQGVVYGRNIIDRVQQEAQNQADIREAELRGITVEQLLAMRQQSQAMLGDSMTETLEEENSHGMKR